MALHLSATLFLLDVWLGHIYLIIILNAIKKCYPFEKLLKENFQGTHQTNLGTTDHVP